MEVSEEIKGDDLLPSTGQLELYEMLEDDDNAVIWFICGETTFLYGKKLIQRGVAPFSNEIDSNNIYRVS